MPRAVCRFSYANLSTMFPQRPHAFDADFGGRCLASRCGSRSGRRSIITARSAPTAAIASPATIASWSAPSAATI